MSESPPVEILVEGLPLPLLVFGPDRRLLVANAALRAFASARPDHLKPGTPAEEVARFLAYRGLLGVGDPAALAAEAAAADRSRPSKRLIRLPDGRSIEIHSAPLAAGGFLTVTIDVTPLVAAQAEAAGQARRLAEIVSALATGIAVFGADGRLLLHNPAYPGLVGLAPGLLREGMNLSEVIDLLEQRGEFAALPEGAVPEFLRQPLAAGPRRFQRRRPTGEVIESRRSSLTEGAFLIEVSDVTARQAAEDEARRRAALLDAILEALPHAVSVYGPDERVVMVNRAHRHMIGAAEVGKALAQVLREQAEAGAFGLGDPAELAEAELALRRRGETMERVRRRPDGRVFTHRIAPLPDGGHVSVATDITALAEAEAAASAREALLRSLVEAMPFGVKLFDAEHRLVAFNEAAVRLSGLAAEDIALGMTADELVARQIARGEFAAAPEHAERLQAIDRSRVHRYRRRRPTGEVLDVASLPMPGGGFLLTFHDVTALVRAEAEAKAQAALLQAMIDNTEAGVLRFDAAERLVAANAVAMRMEGISAEDVARGITRAELLARIAARGGFAGTPGRYAEVAALPATAPRAYRRTAADGRVVDVVARPMPDGGFLVTLNDVTPLVRAEEEAKRRAALLQGMIDNASYGIALYDREHRFVAANALGYAFVGLPPEEMRPGTPYAELVARQVARGEFPAETQAMLLAVDRSRPHAYRRVRADGTVLEIESKPMPDGGFVVSFADVTALVRAEEAEKRRAETLRAMLDNIASGVLLYGPDHRLVAVNRTALALTGLSAEEAAPGTPRADILRLLAARGEFADDPEADARMAARLRGDSLSYIRTRPDGTKLAVQVAPMPGGGVIVTLTDVTRLLRAEEELRRRAAMQAAMLDNLRHGIMLFDADSRLLAANPLAARLAGIPPEMMRPGVSVEELRRAQIAAGEFTAEEAARRGLTNVIAAPARYVRTRPDGTIVEVTTDRTPEGFFVRTYTDVTEDRRIRADLEAARAAAETAARAKSRFLATMTHELRTPLNAVIGFAELLRTPQPPELQTEYAEMIAQAGRELLGLIDQILDVARSETVGLPVRAGRVALAPLLARVAEVRRPAADAAGLRLRLELPPDLPEITADGARLEQVLQGLLSNALKFTKPGGEVTLSARTTPEGGITLRIADSGIGIAPEALPRLFEPFFQAEEGRARRFAGSGIGLYLARSIAEAMGMRLSLESRLGAGTTAMLDIPPDLVLSPEEESA